MYHGYVLNSNNALSEEFTEFKYSQNVTNLYPELDKDNVDDNPGPMKSFAKRAQLEMLYLMILQKVLQEKL